MDRVEEIIASAEALTADVRRRLLRDLGAMEARSAARAATAQEPEEENAIQALLRLAGSASSDYTDLSTDKYRHAADAKR